VTATATATTATTLEPFARAYLIAMLWSSLDDNDTPLDYNHGTEDLSDLSLCRTLLDCDRFQRVNSAELAECERRLAAGEWSLPANVSCSVREYAGHDFWLTRTGHGAGFWDGDWPEDLAPLLTRSAESFGEVSPYIGDDNLIHLSD
jgi:hypothetical protein